MTDDEVAEVFACRPVDFSELLALAPTLPETPVHPGSIRGECEVCEEAVWIGPRQQQRQKGGGVVVCFLCAIKAIRAANGMDVPVTLRGLGNSDWPATESGE